MLEIHNVENLDSKNLNITRRKSKKNQILLYDTSRRADDFIGKIRYRNNEKYNQIPHFIITKLGTVYQIFDTNHYSNTFDDPQIDKQFIKIAIENLGWLNKNTITGFLTNWIYINSNAYDKILQWEQNGKPLIDLWFMSSFNIWCCYPLLGVQKNGYSDIDKSIKNNPNEQTQNKSNYERLLSSWSSRNTN